MNVIITGPWSFFLLIFFRQESQQLCLLLCLSLLFTLTSLSAFQSLSFCLFTIKKIQKIKNVVVETTVLFWTFNITFTSFTVSLNTGLKIRQIMSVTSTLLRQLFNILKCLAVCVILSDFACTIINFHVLYYLFLITYANCFARRFSDFFLCMYSIRTRLFLKTLPFTRIYNIW